MDAAATHPSEGWMRAAAAAAHACTRAHGKWWWCGADCQTEAAPSDKHRSGMQKEDMAGQSCRSSSLVPTQSGNRPTGEAQETETETVKDKRHEQERM
ncbi:hypothetical protein PCL_09364 [Purpureocillium lilacinum]|uniref:Uncharacterized protein n=1 Tax=Purpureocillium lilacinum TaxID=33203 RepID=A0A2U3EHV0_PURLI|nr:hypothetical protein PCL_09364 [Purpureocillium lilacinum]